MGWRSRSTLATKACIALELCSSGEERAKAAELSSNTHMCFDVCTSTYTSYTQQIRVLGIEYKGANFPMIGVCSVVLCWTS